MTTRQDASVPPSDDGMHPVGDEPTFSESAYFQLGDVRSGLSGFVRLANRPNEAGGERTICLFLPDGRVAFSFERPAFEAPEVLAAAGLRVDVVDPLEHQRVSFAGDVLVLEDGWAMTEPRSALSGAPSLTCAIDLDARALAPARFSTLDQGGEFSAHHFDQFASLRGTIRLGDLELEVDGQGLRDRSWGPRSWQAVRFYRFMFGAGPEFGLAAAVFGQGDELRTGGYVWDGSSMQPLERVRARARYDDADRVVGVDLDVSCAERSWTITGEPVNAIPLRSRRNGETTRILETALRWRVGEHEFLGVAEFLDQVVDGRPVGIAAYDASVAG